MSIIHNSSLVLVSFPMRIFSVNFVPLSKSSVRSVKTKEIKQKFKVVLEIFRQLRQHFALLDDIIPSVLQTNDARLLELTQT